MASKPELPEDKKSTDEFARQARQKQTGLVREFIDFLAHSKKWWLTPIVVMLLLIGLLVILGSTGAAPFIYTLF
ncbi:MAG: DUF5989 family protein [Thermoguttaceae bacterium]|jgi:hypothetical protein